MAENLDRGIPGEAVALGVARILLAAIFLQSSIRKFGGLPAFSEYLVGHGVPAEYAFYLAVLAAVVELVGALLVLFGLLTRLAALLMALFTLVAALIGHRFWQIADPGQWSDQMIHFMKDVAIVGGFLALYVAGPGRLSIDRRRR